MEELNHISIEKLFWVRFQRHQLNFSFKGKLSDIHFTVAFNSNSEYVNLHLTRNVPNIDGKLKPRFDIVIISKNDLEEFADELPIRLLNLMLEPFDLEKLKAKHGDEIAFLSQDVFKEGEEQYAIIQKQLTDGFKKHSVRHRKSRIKIQDSILESLKDFATSPEIHNCVLQHAVQLPEKFEKPFEAGMLITDEEVVHVIRDGNRWMKMREDVRPEHLLECITNPELAKQLISYTKRSLVRLKKANTIRDTEYFNNPIYLYRVKNSPALPRTNFS